MEKIIEKLEKLAVKECWLDDMKKEKYSSGVNDYAGGNIDDAFTGGINCGEIILAREILELLKNT